MLLDKHALLVCLWFWKNRKLEVQNRKWMGPSNFQALSSIILKLSVVPKYTNCFSFLKTLMLQNVFSDTQSLGEFLVAFIIIIWCFYWILVAIFSIFSCKNFISRPACNSMKYETEHKYFYFLVMITLLLYI